mgnify:FL=1
MKKEDYEKAKSLESFIAEIDSILTDIKKQPASYNVYTLTGLDTKVKINMILGEQFTAELRQKVIDAFMLKKLLLEKEFAQLIKT